MVVADALAYIDAGSASFLLYGLVGGASAIAMTVKLKWRALKARFAKLRRRGKGPEDV